MKKIILTAILTLSAVAPSFAQSDMEMMRLLTVNALMQYGEKLYDRRDFDEATAVFNHVLAYDSHQAKALKYLKEMGHAPASISTPALPAPIAKAPVEDILVIKKSDKQIVSAVDVSETESLKNAIEAQKRIVARLRAQVAQMRTDLTNQSAVNLSI